MIKLKSLLSEKFVSKAQQKYMFATNPTVAKKLASKMTDQDYKELPDKVDEDSLNEKGTRCWKGYKKKGMKTMFGKRVPNCVKQEAKLPDDGFSEKDQMLMYEDEIEEDLRSWFGTGAKGSSSGGGWDRYNTKGEKIGKCGDPKKNRRGKAKNVSSTTKKESVLDEKSKTKKRDACYHKVKARYKVWPSAYASGALVQCRKKGAANWGNKSKK